MAKKGKLTPMMQQYMQIKEENKDCILFYMHFGKSALLPH